MSRRLPLVLLGALIAIAALPAVAGAQKARQSIVQGQQIAIEQAPYQVRLEVDLTQPLPGVFTGQCGGVIRDATHVVTAAHCATDEGVLGRSETAPANVRVFSGSADREAQQEGGVAAVDVPQEYLAGDNTYDAALITLAAPLPGFGGSTVNRAPFASEPELTAAVAGGQQALATGWGLESENGAVSRNLKGVSLPLRGDEVCADRYPGAYASDRGVCAGGGSAAQDNPDTCQGDSGGPLVINVGGQAKLVGVTSFGDGCGRQNTPGAYTEAPNAAICAFLGASAECMANAAIPPSPAVRDTVRPTARLASLRCRRTLCAFSVRTSDNSGATGISMRVTRRARVCRRVDGRRRCRTVTKVRKLKAKRARGGFTTSQRLRPSRYRFEAVATDPSRNRSARVIKRFTVKKR